MEFPSSSLEELGAHAADFDFFRGMGGRGEGRIWVVELKTSTPECKLILKNCFYFCDWFFHSLTHSKSLKFCDDLGRRGRREVARKRDREQISVRTTSLGGGRQLNYSIIQIRKLKTDPSRSRDCWRGRGL